MSSNDKNPELLRKVQSEVMPKEREDRENMFEGEITKTKEQIQIIHTALDLIKKKLLSLNLIDDLSVELPVSIERIHILTKESYPVVVADGSYDDREMGVYHPILDQIFIKDTEDRLEVFLTVLHELIHYFSYRTDFLGVFDDESVDLRERRVGYRNLNYGKDPHEHFRGFNEMAVEWVGFGIAINDEDAIKQALGLKSDKDKEHVDDIWNEALIWNDAPLFMSILEGISKYYEEDLLDTSARIERGLFTGEMMHLRDVEKVYGKKALRILSYYKSTIIKEGVDMQALNSMIEDYFMSIETSAEDREALGKRILGMVED